MTVQAIPHTELDFEQKIQWIKQSVRDMLAEREHGYRHDGIALASEFWVKSLQRVQYLMDLPDKHFRNIRYHTLFLSGGQFYTMMDPPPDPRQLAMNLGYHWVTRSIPRRYWLSEPKADFTNDLFDFSFNYKEHWVNFHIAWYQKTVFNLYQAGFFEDFRHPVIVEIGTGYGGLAHGLFNCLESGGTYILVDLPEMFLFSASYIALNNPSARIYIYQPETFSPDIVTGRRYDFIFLPNYQFRELQNLAEINLFLNTQSFQEMTEPQVSAYLDLAQSKLNGFLYSDNLDRHTHNPSLHSVTQLLQERFNLTPPARYYDQIEQRDQNTLYRRYVGVPKTQDWDSFDYDRLAIPY